MRQLRLGRSGGLVGVIALTVGVLPFSPPAAGAAAGTLTLVSHTPAGPTTAPVGESDDPVVSADGAYVAFVSNAANLVSGQSDTNNNWDIFLYERATGIVTLVSHTPASATTAANGYSTSPSISADGAFVAFQSFATNLVPGQSDSNAGFDVFLFARTTGTVTLVSHTATNAATAAESPSTSEDISADGAFVPFVTDATDVVAAQNDANDHFDVFLFERATGGATLVSHSTSGPNHAGNGLSTRPRVSADAAFVAFESRATNLVPAQSDSGTDEDVFLFERATGSVTLVSHTPASAVTAGNASAGGAAISGDGAFVAFHSSATNLVAGQSDTSGTTDVFLLERATGAVTLVSHAATGATTAANAVSFRPSISDDGAFVAYASEATNLVTSQIDGNGDDDALLFRRATSANTLVSHTPGTATTTGDRGIFDPPQVSANGAFVAFDASATNLVGGQTDTNMTVDVFLFRRTTQELSLVSHAATSTNTTASGSSYHASISADGGFVGIESTAANLVGGQSDANGTYDAFLYQRTGDPVPPVDFDGDADTDIAVYRPPSGFWFVQGGAVTPFGTSGDIPVPADYDGDGDVDRAVFRPSNGYWFVDGAPASPWGTSGDIPVPADYNGDGDVDRAVYRPGVQAYWFVQNGLTVAWGTSGDIPVPADYNGDGDAEITVFRPSTGTWFTRQGATVAWGTSGDIPVPGDYDGDGDVDRAVYRPGAQAYWFVHGGATAAWGTSGDVPVPGDYQGGGTTELAVFRPDNGYWFVNGGATTQFGTSGDVPLPLPDAIRRFFFTPL